MSLGVIHHPSGQEVTSTEALQGGLAAQNRALTSRQAERIKKFVGAHMPTPTHAANKPEELRGLASNAPTGGAQVSAHEQQQAMLSRGVQTKSQAGNSSRKSKHQRLYHALFTTDDIFFERDVHAELSSFRRRSKSLVDISPKLNPQEKALRRYLLLEHLLGEQPSKLTESEQIDLRVAVKRITEKNGDFIAGSIGAYEVGKAKKLAGPSLREFIRGFQFLDEQSGMLSSNGLHPLYKVIKPLLMKNEDGVKKLTEMQQGFIQVLVREKTQEPTRATSPRHHLMLSRIKQFGHLIAVHQDHVSFLDWAKKSMRNLPDEHELIDVSLQLVSTKETLPAVNSLVRLASSVESDRLPARNTFVANYRRWLLEGKNLLNLYINPEHQVTVVKQVNQNMTAGSILSITASTNTV